MADVKPIGKALFLREEELRRGIELMFLHTAISQAGSGTPFSPREIWGVRIIAPFTLLGAIQVSQ